MTPTDITIEQLEHQLTTATVTVASARRQAEVSASKVRQARQTLHDLTVAHTLLVALSDSRRDVVRVRIEATVTAALRAVFGPNLSFRLDASIKRGVVNFEPQIGYGPTATRRWTSISNVGGGVVDVTAFALRVAVVLSTPSLRQVIIADEPFKHVSDIFLDPVAAMLRRLADDAGLQLIIISHEEQLADAAHQLLTITKPGELSKIAVSYPAP